jgi:hypothetical protein
VRSAEPLAVVTPDGAVALADMADGAVGRTAAWKPGAPGLEWSEIELAGSGESRRIKVIAVRLDPARFRLSLENGMAPGGFLQVWTLALADKADMAVNAGMFEGNGAWGWVVHGGVEYREPRTGPLARAVVVGSTGEVRLLGDEAVRAVRANKADEADRADRANEAVKADGTDRSNQPTAPTAMPAVTEAFQSYPALLDHGQLPAMLTPGVSRGGPEAEEAEEAGVAGRSDGHGAALNPAHAASAPSAPSASPALNLAHRDARLALGVDANGHLIVALTRFDALGPALGSIPFGLTIPETALLMRALGAQDAVALDGGISAQLLVRDASGEAHRWPGLRAVPLALSAVAAGKR